MSGIVKLLSLAPGKATKCPIVIFRHYTYFGAISCFARRRVCLRAAVRRVTLETDTSYTRTRALATVWSGVSLQFVADHEGSHESDEQAEASLTCVMTLSVHRTFLGHLGNL